MDLLGGKGVYQTCDTYTFSLVAKVWVLGQTHSVALRWDVMLPLTSDHLSFSRTLRTSALRMWNSFYHSIIVQICAITLLKVETEIFSSL